jgi:hypothetical protein
VDYRPSAHDDDRAPDVGGLEPVLEAEVFPNAVHLVVAQRAVIEQDLGNLAPDVAVVDRRCPKRVSLTAKERKERKERVENIRLHA